MWTSTKFLRSMILLVFSSVASPIVLNKGNVLIRLIVGGDNASIEDYPYQVSYTVNQSYFCGGFIVSEYYIVTAAHCVQNVDPSTVVLRAGSSFRTNGTIIPLSKVIPHPEFNKTTFDKDVAVMQTTNRIEFNDSMQPIKLPSKGRRMEDNTEVRVSGWGETMIEGNRIPERLMTVEIPVVKHSYCAKVYSSELTDNEWCGGNFVLGGQGPCKHDNGSAAAQDKMAVGIVSFRLRCGDPLSPSVFADIAAPAIRDFITEHTGL